MSVETWLLFIAVSIAPALSPGPAGFLAISNTIRFGGHATLWSAFGNSTGLLALGIIVALGLGAILTASPLLFTGLHIVGACYLIYLGYRMIRSGGQSVPEVQNSKTPYQRRTLYTTALIVALTNPKAILMLAALFPPFLTEDAPILPQITILSCTFAALCYLAHVVIILIVGSFRRQVQSTQGLKTISIVVGCLFVAYGIIFLVAI